MPCSGFAPVAVEGYVGVGEFLFSRKILISGQAVVPWSFLLIAIIRIMLFGILAGQVAFWIVISSPLMQTLRQE